MSLALITTFSPDVNAPFEVYLSASIYVKQFEDICPAEAISLVDFPSHNFRNQNPNSKEIFHRSYQTFHN